MTDLLKKTKQVLEKQGIRVLDDLQIDLMVGGKRSKTLNRAKYLFKSDDTGRNFQEESDRFTYYLPVLKGESFEVEIVLDEQFQSYVALSKTDCPFRVNGIYTSKAFLQNNDEIQLGHNHLYFRRKSENRPGDPSIFTIPLSEKAVLSRLMVLIEGETGTGKTSLAQRIHEQSRRPGKFVHINLSSFSKTLLESELFGHVKGAFTGAMTDRKGAFMESHKGTLFLDEIDSLPPELQVKLLIFLDNQVIRAVGSNIDQRVDTRVIMASGKRLSTLVKNGQMRNDFYYRAKSGVSIYLKSLREDPKLVEAFCQNFEREKNISYQSGLVDYYKTLSWPGNYRQLQSHLNRKWLTSNSSFLVFDQNDEEIESGMQGATALDHDGRFITIKDLKCKYARRVFFELGKNIELTSSTLGINYKTLKSMLNMENVS